MNEKEAREATPAYTHGFDEYLEELLKDHWTETRWDYSLISDDPENL